MLHRLTIGHFDPAAVERRQTVATKALDMEIVDRLLAELGEKDAEGNRTLGGCKVEFQNASVTCLWKAARTNHVAEEFALRMQKETGCLIADVGGYRVVDPTELSGLNGLTISTNSSSHVS
jgi:hypothetical protein